MDICFLYINRRLWWCPRCSHRNGILGSRKRR